MKKISVIIPVYNAEKLLPRLIKSIEVQTCLDRLEFIFINDGSKDNSLKVLNSIDMKNVKIIDQKNGGVSSARNNGIKNASYDYIAFIDADDYIDADLFEKYLEKLDKYDYDLIISGYIAEYEDGRIIYKKNNERELTGIEKILKDFFIGKIDPNCWNKLFKKDILINCLFDEKMSYGEDRDMLFRYLNYCSKIFINEFTKYHYYINNNSAMRKFNPKTLDTISKSEERVDFVKENYPNIYEYAYSNDIDTKCRVLCGLYNFKQEKKYDKVCKKLKRDIKKCSIFRKKKYSSRKHFLAYLAARISPRIYVFFKEKMRMQYK